MGNCNILIKLSLRMTVITLLTMMVVTVTARDVEQARQAAILQMKKHAAKKAINKDGATTVVTPQLVYSKAKCDNESYYYVFSAGKDMGYTMVSGDDRLPAIVGYTENGDFDIDQLPEALADFLNAYQDFVDNATDSQINEVTAWRTQAKHAPVEPLMKEKWHQDNPYNNMCPEYTAGKRSAAGCVATAVAQILHYWKCPNKLKAYIPAYETQQYKISMPGISAGEQYDWQNILNEYTGSETAVQNNAVAKLMLHVGCACRMSYGASSYASASPKVFVEYFGMDKKYVHQVYRSHYELPMWEYVLYNEISAKRPVFYEGFGNGSGHAFVIHGYDNGLYYVNWGWGGYADGYYDIAILYPTDSGNSNTISSDYGYNKGNRMIVGIQPESGDKDGSSSPIFISRFFDVEDIKSESVFVKGSACITVSNYFSDAARYVSVGYIDHEDVVHRIANAKLTNSRPINEWNAYPGKVDCEIEFSAENDREYTFYVIESKDQKQWYVSGIEYDPVQIKVHDGEIEAITLTPILSAEVALDKESDGLPERANKINVTINNSGGREYYGDVFVYIASSPEMEESLIKGFEIIVPAKGCITKSFEYTPATAGTYNFRIKGRGKTIGQNTITFDIPSEPTLSLVSIKCKNASEEKIYADYMEYKAEMDKVNDTKAIFEFEIKNLGRDCEVPFPFYKYTDYGWEYCSCQTIPIPAYTTIVLGFSLEGKTGDVVGLMVDWDEDMNIIGVDNKYNRENCDDALILHNAAIAYLAGSNPDSITETMKDVDDAGVIYNLYGEKVETPTKGIYIKNGKKYVIK